MRAARNLRSSLRRFSPAITAVVAVAASSAHAQIVTSLAPMIEKVSPAVVNISVSGSVDVDNPLADNPFFRGFIEPRERPVQGSGSGVIVSASEGLILTNHHVIENADKITVTLLDNRATDATVIGSDEASDLAVLRIDIDDLEQIELGDSDQVRVGDFVVAIGNPFGFSHTVTSGIVSGLGRSGINPNRSAYEDFIQTDASINPGNSGGALVNMQGQLVGINSAIISRTGGNIGIGFAIPVTMARYVMEQIIDHGSVQRGLLGVVIRSVTPALLEQYALPDTAGAFVTDVTPGSAAESAGLSIEDVIVGVDGRAVTGPDSLRNLIGLHRPGESVEIEYIRNGVRESVTAVLGSNDAETITAARVPAPREQTAPVIAGVELMADDDGGENRGLRVVSIDENSEAYLAGLQRGDLILRLNRQRVTSIEEARAIVREAPRGIVALVRRGNRESIVLLP
ncbi:MAG: Do family serine endopeptidase [Gammaproteobacteria bacterium]|jgi:Do/DeqQ family serine protease